MTSPQHIWRPLPALIVALMLLVGASACGGDDDDNGESFDARQVVEDAAEKLAAAETFRFELSHANGSTEIIQDMQMTSAEGEVVSPDRLRADIDVTLLGQTLEIEVVGIGEQVWISNPFDASQWQLAPGTTAREVLDLTALPDVMRAVEDPESAGIDEIDGQAHYRVRASVDSQSLEAVIPAAANAGQTVEVEIWVGQDDSYTRRIVLQGPLSDDEDEDIERDLQLSGFGEPITIDPPE